MSQKIAGGLANHVIRLLIIPYTSVSISNTHFIVHPSFPLPSVSDCNISVCTFQRQMPSIPPPSPFRFPLHRPSSDAGKQLGNLLRMSPRFYWCLVVAKLHSTLQSPSKLKHWERLTTQRDSANSNNSDGNHMRRGILKAGLTLTLQRCGCSHKKP